VRGVSTFNGGNGVIGQADTGANAYGVWGRSNSGYGVVGEGAVVGVRGQGSTSAPGVDGISANGDGVHGQSGGNGVYGTSTGLPLGAGGIGVRGFSSATENGAGVFGIAPNGIGVRGTGGDAALFEGRVIVTGPLIKQGGGFMIDHPLDPANTYLVHSFVESPDMKNVYDGTVTTDARGEAVVQLPTYFEVLNRDFRYQLTPIGAPAPGLYVSEEVSGTRFKIAGGPPNIRVSWQVTGIRKDPFAEAYRLVPEQAKPAADRGTYLAPELYGQPRTARFRYRADLDLDTVNPTAQPRKSLDPPPPLADLPKSPVPQLPVDTDTPPRLKVSPPPRFRTR
jgi:hypothetical protein